MVNLQALCLLFARVFASGPGTFPGAVERGEGRMCRRFTPSDITPGERFSRSVPERLVAHQQAEVEAHAAQLATSAGVE